jgi:putative spermidine/putrescine transport system substrate-binding protein
VVSKKTIAVLVVVAAVLSALVFIFSRTPAKEKKHEVAPSEISSTREIVVLSYGGEFAEAQRGAYFKPFQEHTGVTVSEASYNGEYGKLKSMVESGNVTWDVVDVESSALLRGIQDGIFQRVDREKLQVSDLIPEAVNDFAVGTDFYSVSLGFNSEQFPPGKPQPQNWKDFWDVEKFPGPRSLKKDPRFTLEIALLADGVPLAEVYDGGKLDVDRAFTSLDRIKPHITVWWTSGQQPIQLLSDGEVDLAAAFGARIYNAQHKDGLPVSMSWEQGLIDVEYWGILRGAKNPNLSIEFINFASRPDRQAAFSSLIPLGPVNKQAFRFLSPELASELNTHPENFSKQLILNAKFWAENEESIRDRFNKWLGE